MNSNSNVTGAGGDGFKKISHSPTLDMLNNFCFPVYAQKSLSTRHALFTGKNDNGSFYLSQSSTRAPDIKSSWSWFPAKNYNKCKKITADNLPQYYPLQWE